MTHPQEPHRPIGIALAFKGKPGTGKSTFAKWFGPLFGVHFLHLDSQSAATAGLFHLRRLTTFVSMPSSR